MAVFPKVRPVQPVKEEDRGLSPREVGATTPTLTRDENFLSQSKRNMETNCPMATCSSWLAMLPLKGWVAKY